MQDRQAQQRLAAMQDRLAQRLAPTQELQAHKR